MDTKKKVTYAVIAIIVAFLAWQMLGMFSGEGEVAQGTVMKTNPEVPKVTTLLSQQPAQKQTPMTEREIQLTQLQQETQTKYLAALNDLQMLKVEKEIAETNRDVSKARLEGITAQKGIVDLLTPAKQEVTAATYAQGLEQSGSAVATTTTTTTTPTTSSDSSQVKISAGDSFRVISISRTRGQWMAVLGYSGSLYNVKNGDVLPGDGSVVISIQRDGVQLEKNGVRRMVSLVPII